MEHTTMENFNLYFEIALSVLRLVTYFIILIFTVKLFRSAKISTLLTAIHSAKDDQSSWTRAVGTVIILFAIVLAFYQVYKTGEAQEGLIIGLIGAALAGKVGQKFAERSNTDYKDYKRNEKFNDTKLKNNERKDSEFDV